MGNSEKRERKNNNRRIGPMFFSEFGKRALDLVRKNYRCDEKILKISTLTATGQGIHWMVVINRSTRFAMIESHFNLKGSSLVVNLDSAAQVMGRLDIGLQFSKAAAANYVLIFPNYDSKLSFYTFNKYATLSMLIDLNRQPDIRFRSSLGTRSLALGWGATYKTSSRRLVKSAIGVQATGPTYAVSFLYVPRMNSVGATCLYHLGKEKTVTAALEIQQSLTRNCHSFIAGVSWAIGSLATVVKATIDHRGLLQTHLRHYIRDHNSWVSISSTFDTKALNRLPRTGLSIVLAP